MKTSFKFLLLSLFIFNGYTLKAQDIITLKNGEKIQGKILEIGLKEIKYKAFNNLEGPIITIKKSSVQEIIYENGTQTMINKPKSDTTKQNEISPDDTFIISPNLRIKTVPSSVSGGYGLTFCRAFFGNFSCDYLGLGFDKFYNEGWNGAKTKRLSLQISNKFFFSKFSRRFKPFLLTDIGWSLIINKQEIADYLNNKNHTDQFTTDRFKNGLYAKPGLGLDFLINKNNSVYFDLCFDMNFYMEEPNNNSEFLGFITRIFNSHDDLYFLFRIGYTFKL